MAEIVVQFEGTVYENGYGQIAKKVMRDKSIHAVAKAIYAYLVSYAGSKDNSFPSVQLMMDELGIRTEGTFYKYRKQLEEAGYITITQDQGEGGKWLNNVYHIETVPVPKVERKEPYSVFQSTVKVTNRTLKNGVRKKPSAVNQGTNNNSSLIKTESNICVCIDDENARIMKTAQEALEIQPEEFGKNEIHEWRKKYGEAHVLAQIEIIAVQGSSNPIRSLREAVQRPWKTPKANIPAQSKKQRTSQNTKPERIVPAVQSGKYERFYQVYGNQTQNNSR